jgi:arylsulfatase
MPNTSGRPNILFFFPDQLRFDWLSSRSDLPIRTPNLERLQKEGITFNHTIVASPVCAPSRATLALGVEYDNCPVQGNGDNVPLDANTVYKQLRNSGYHVMGCGKFDLNKGTCTSRQPAWGLDGKLHLDEWGFSDGINNEGKQDGKNSGREKPQGPYMQFLEERGLREVHVEDFDKRYKMAYFPTPLPDDCYGDNWIAQNGLDLIDSVPDDKPWFLQININGPHGPWDITECMVDLYNSEDMPVPYGDLDEPVEEYQGVRRNYSAMVENIDRWVGIYLDKLEERGELENTLIVFSSDHGEMLGDRDAWGKGKPFHPSASVPLIISGPGVQTGTQNDLPMTHLDFTATFLDYAGLETPSEMDSRSFKALLEGQTDTHRDIVISGLNNWRLAYDGRYKLIRYNDGDTQLFDLKNDPEEAINLTADPDYTDIQNRLNEHLPEAYQIK